MASVTPSPALPTLDRLGASVQSDINAQQIAEDWFKKFTSGVESGNAEGVTSLLVDDAYWRDILSLTWHFRTFHGKEKIHKFLGDRLANANLKAFALENVELQKVYDDLVWIQGLFKFEVGEVGAGDGVFRIVPTKDGEWKAHTVYTNLQSLKGHPEQVGVYRNQKPNHGKWVDARAKEVAFENEEPHVLVIGAGQSGLDVAARLKYLNVPTLVVEKNERIGDPWRNRYEALCLHDPVWYDHMPYIPFPASWPVWTPAYKLADWLESYAHSLELNVWTSSPATSVRRDPKTKGWTVTIKRNGQDRIFHPFHVIFALGLAGGVPNMPKYPGQEDFQGQILHSTKHKSARDHANKKVVIFGSATSAHDIAMDYVDHGVDVTMYQRSAVYVMSTKEGHPRFLPAYVEGGPPTDIVDRVGASFPLRFLKSVHQRVVKEVAEADKELLDGLQKVGFKTHFGEDGSGFLFLAFQRGGGYYLDVGASQMIIDGKIKLKSDSEVESFTKTGLKFKDGSELATDVVVYATGFGDIKEYIRTIAGDELTNEMHTIWSLDEEGESKSAWKYTGVDNLWYMMGNLAMCRYHSRHLALQIKAIKEGLYGTRYEA